MYRSMIKSLEFTVSSPEELMRLGTQIAPMLRAADVLFLIGDLGAGKTTLAKGILSALTGKTDEVTSPTYNLVHIWDGGAFEIWHADLYRLDGPAEVAQLGFDEAFERCLTLIEWPDRMGDLAPDDRLDIKIEKTLGGRKVTLRPMSQAWKDRLHAP